MTTALHVRELQLEDVAIVDEYWRTRTDEELSGMGVDKDKLLKVNLATIIRDQLAVPYENKRIYFLIWMEGDKAVGHSNVNKITFCQEAYVHMHLWQPAHRQRGMGTEFVRKSSEWYFDKLQLKVLCCETHALHSAPNRTLARAGFRLSRSFEGTPGMVSLHQPVNVWELTREEFDSARS
ncbi:N-acetyltransferase [archaeon]|nr:MAG: N-acetyltransferase [archaeon]